MFIEQVKFSGMEGFKFFRQNYGRALLSLSVVFSIGCTGPVTSSGPQDILNTAVTTSLAQQAKTPPDRSSGNYQFIADCARKTNFGVKGNIEGNPCEYDTFPGMEKFIIPPEYTPSRAVMVSDVLNEIPGSNELFKAIIQAGGDIWFLSRKRKEVEEVKTSLNLKDDSAGANLKNIRAASETVWARDWAPLMAVPDSGYNGEKVDLKMIDANYYPDRPLDDSISRQIHNQILKKNNNPGLNLVIKRAAIPVYMEGGNVMCSTRTCFLTDKVLNENSKSYAKADQILDEASLKAEFKKQISQDIKIVPGMPYEPTKHIDMWAKFLDENTLIVNYISDETVKTAPPDDYRKYKDLQEFFDIQATGKNSLGKDVGNSLGAMAKAANPELMVLRIPMPAPDIQEDKDGNYDGVFRSYTNSLLLNGYALVPRYLQDFEKQQPYRDAALQADYEKEVKDVYEKAGYKVIWLVSDGLINIGGATHCVTMQIPGRKN